MFVPRKLIITGVAAVFAVGGAGVATASSLQKEVTLVVDGQTVHVNGYVSTVGDVLANRSVALQGKDTVQPSAETQVKDGETVTVTRIRAKQVTVAHDGTTSTLTTFSSTVAGALYDAGVTVNVTDRVSPRDHRPAGRLPDDHHQASSRHEHSDDRADRVHVHHREGRHHRQGHPEGDHEGR